MIRTVSLKLVTPAMIGGSSPRKCDDPAVLRPPAVRGMLRFWTRALAYGFNPALEGMLWGSTEVGQGIRILNAPPLQNPITHKLFPHKPKEKFRASVPMEHPDGVPFQLRFWVPESADLNTVRAVVWTWLHLGSVGRRARRGYGSLLWFPRIGDPKDLLGDFVPFNYDEDLLPANLAPYLKRGLNQVLTILGKTSVYVPRRSSDWFCLETLDQVFVGKCLMSTYDPTRMIDTTCLGMECLIHGKNPNGRSPLIAEKAQMGDAKPRLASPMIWRLFPAAGGGYIPVMTWSPRGGTTDLTRGTGMFSYLNGMLGFDQSLAGNSLWL